MHQPNPISNPLDAAARQVMSAARETKSPLMDRLALVVMVSSAVVSTGLGIAQVVRMVSHDKEKAEERAYQRFKREHERERAEEGPYHSLKRELDAKRYPGESEHVASHGRGR